MLKTINQISFHMSLSVSIIILKYILLTLIRNETYQVVQASYHTHLKEANRRKKNIEN